MTTYLSRHFTLEELIHSATAIAHGIENTPTRVHLANLTNYTAPGLEQVRGVCGNTAVNVHDAYRNPQINKIVGGTATSAHPMGFAADIDVPGQTPLSTFRRIAHAMRAGLIHIDQLILERTPASTVHCSFDPRIGREGKPRGMIGRQAGGPGTPIDWNFYKGEPT